MLITDLPMEWYALRTRSRFENVVLDGLEKKKVEVFLPRITIKSMRLDRKTMIQVPLFPGYLFVKTSMDPYKQIEIAKTIGVVKFVGNLQGPSAIPMESIDSLKIMVLNSQEILIGFKYKRGDLVRVVNGPFVGVLGEFVRYRGKGRVVVSIAALGQNAAVNVSEDDIEMIRDNLLITA